MTAAIKRRWKGKITLSSPSAAMITRLLRWPISIATGKKSRPFHRRYRADDRLRRRFAWWQRRPAALPLRGDSVTVIAALKEFAPPGTFVGLRLSGGKTGVFQVRSPEEREAGVPVKVMMSKHRAPLAVADQDPVASRAGLRLSPETTEPSHCVVQRVVVEVARSGADCAPPVAHTCTGLFPCRRKSLSARRTRRRTWRAA